MISHQLDDRLRQAINDSEAHRELVDLLNALIAGTIGGYDPREIFSVSAFSTTVPTVPLDLFGGGSIVVPEDGDYEAYLEIVFFGDFDAGQPTTEYLFTVGINVGSPVIPGAVGQLRPISYDDSISGPGGLVVQPKSSSFKVNLLGLTAGQTIHGALELLAGAGVSFVSIFHRHMTITKLPTT